MTDYELRWWATVIVCVTVSAQLLSRIILFGRAKELGRRIAHDFDVGYLLSCVGSAWAAMQVLEGCAMQWSEIMIQSGWAIVLFKTMREWSPTKIPEFATTDDPSIAERVAQWWRGLKGRP